MNIHTMTHKDFEALPCREWDEDIGLIDSLILLPLRRIHDSGYRCLDFIAVKNDEATCRLSGCSDVIHIEGICGFGYGWMKKYKGCPALVPPKAWSIDCLKKSGLLRMFINNSKIRVGAALSSFEIYSDNDKEG